MTNSKISNNEAGRWEVLFSSDSGSGIMIDGTYLSNNNEHFTIQPNTSYTMSFDDNTTGYLTFKDSRGIHFNCFYLRGNNKHIDHDKRYTGSVTVRGADIIFNEYAWYHTPHN